VEFNGSFGLTEFGPIEETPAQIDHRRVENEEFILETESPRGSKPASQIQQALENFLIAELPRPVGIGVTEG
jgi:hypothetical protein